MVTLPPRLSVIAGLIPAGAHVADIGTDHARLPIYLMQRGLAASVLATDVHPDPLRRARRLLRLCGLEDIIPLRLADGLSGLPLDTIDTVVIAGLGADTILKIWRKNPPPVHVTCLLQPMSHTERLRAFFGASIAAECLVQEETRLYSIMTVTPGGGTSPDAVPPGRRYISHALEHSGDPLLEEYLDRQVARLTAEAIGLTASHRPADAVRRAETEEALRALRALRALKKRPYAG